jgi:hypothetical protein
MVLYWEWLPLRIRRVGPGQVLHERGEGLFRRVRHGPVACVARAVRRLDQAVHEGRPVSARLNEHRFDTEGREFYPVVVGWGFEGELGGVVRAIERDEALARSNQASVFPKEPEPGPD